MIGIIHDEWHEDTGSHQLIQYAREHDNLTITPHSAFLSRESLAELQRRTAGEVARVLNGKMPENVVNPEVLGHTRAAL